MALPVVPHPAGGRAYGRLLQVLRVACSRRSQQSGTVRPLTCYNTFNHHPPEPMTTLSFNVAASLLNRARNGNEMLQILDRLVRDEEDANIADFLNHAATLQEIQF
jgi:hypothetical protein